MKSSASTRRELPAPPPKIDLPVTSGWAGRVPQLKPGTYDDGLPFHQVQYVCCKLMLRPNRFTSRERLFEFTEVMLAPAAKHGVKVIMKGFRDMPLKLREVLFIDTHDFRLY